MNKLLLVASAFVLGACCSSSEARFWEGRDAATGKPVYTVDTAHVPATDPNLVVKYVDATGRFVQPAKPELLRQMSEDAWTQATGGADFAVHYCPMRKGCWAAAHEK